MASETTEGPAAAPARLHDLDALRGFAMLLGLVLHSTLAFLPGFWPAEDDRASFDRPYDEILHAIHGFRMPVFFLLSGFFTAMIWRRRGLQSLLEQRVKRVALPLAIGVVTIVPLMNWVSDRAIAERIDNLLVAAYVDSTTAVGQLLDDGAVLDVRGGTGETPLHAAALIGNAEIAQLLIGAGADPLLTDVNGDSPLAWAFFAGSDEVADLLVEAGHPDWRPAGGDWDDLDGWGFGAEDDDVGLDSWVASFHHLWFLWFILWMVAGFAVIAFAADRWGSGSSTGADPPPAWTGWLMWTLVPLALLPQLLMGGGGDFPVFGPDTSTGLLPLWHVLAYYSAFFAFGALAFGRDTSSGAPVIAAVGRFWFVALPVAVVVAFPIGLELTFESGDWFVASVVQVVYCWLMVFGMLGLFRTVLATERRGVRYLSDSSYWLYLAHLPLMIQVQSWISEWDIPSGVKFVGINVFVAVVLLTTYQLFIRYTPIGTMLNGKRARPRPSMTSPPNA